MWNIKKAIPKNRGKIMYYSKVLTSEDGSAQPINIHIHAQQYPAYNLWSPPNYKPLLCCQCLKWGNNAMPTQTGQYSYSTQYINTCKCWYVQHRLIKRLLNIQRLRLATIERCPGVDFFFSRRIAANRPTYKHNSHLLEEVMWRNGPFYSG